MLFSHFRCALACYKKDSLLIVGVRMRNLFMLLGVLVCYCAVPVYASEEGAEGASAQEEGEHGKKKAAPEKPKPDSVISSVLSLPVVKKWGEWMESKDNGSQIVAWGEYVKEVHGSKCWSIVVAEENAKGYDNIWKRFCMQQTGLEMWVESTLGATDTEESNYITYESWISNCKPTYNSPGKC